MALHALVRTATGEILYERDDVDPGSGTKPGLKWLPVVESTSGGGPVLVSTVNTVTATEVQRVRTFREKTPAEIDAERAANVSTQLGATPAGRALKQAYEGMFFLAKQSNPSLTLAQFRTAIEGLNAIPEAAFFDWIKGKLS
jgi:hypothetical protein